MIKFRLVYFLVSAFSEINIIMRKQAMVTLQGMAEPRFSNEQDSQIEKMRRIMIAASLDPDAPDTGPDDKVEALDDMFFLLLSFLIKKI